MAGNTGGGHGATAGVWIATVIILAGVTIGGIALIFWNWPLFWIGGVAVLVVGCVMAYFTNIMDAVSEYTPAPASAPAAAPVADPDHQ